MIHKLTDAQFKALNRAAHRGDTTVRRGEDASESTIRSLASRYIGTLTFEQQGARRVVTGLEVSTAGWLVWTEESNRREASARLARLVERNRPAVDPIAVFRDDRQMTIDALIDSAFGDITPVGAR